MSFDIQQCRLFTHLSSCFSAPVRTDSRQNEKFGAACRKSYFLCRGRTEIPVSADAFGHNELFFRTASGQESEEEELL